VVGVCSASKAEVVRSLGADRVIDRHVPNWWRPLLDAGERFDSVLDGGGRLPVRTLRRLVTPRGALVLVGAEGGGKLTGGMGRQLGAVLRGPVSRQRIVMLVSREDGRDLEELNGFLQRGQLTAHVDRVVDLDGVADAMRALECGEVTGKIVVVP
jgi:NADPH:quinone reductase-like Zn-dependent oxidoreductase